MKGYYVTFKEFDGVVHNRVYRSSHQRATALMVIRKAKAQIVSTWEKPLESQEISAIPNHFGKEV